MPRSFSILTARLASGSPTMPVNFCLAMKIVSSQYLCGGPDRDRLAHGCPDHFFGAARPAQIEPGVCHQDCQVVTATVTTGLPTRRASSDVVFSHDSCLAHVVKNAKPRPTFFSSLLSDWHSFGSGLADAGRQFFPRGKPVQIVFSDSPEPLEELHLRLQRVLGAIEPETPLCTAVDSQRTADGVAECSCRDRVMFGKDFDA